MKKWVLHIVSFSLCFLFIDACYYFVLKRIPSKQPDKRLELLVTGQIQTDLLVLGSSRAYHNILAEDLEYLLKNKTFNLGFRGTNVSFHLQLLQWYLNYNSAPKIIVYVADIPYIYDRDALQYRTDLLLPFVCHDLFRNHLVEKDKLSKMAYVLNFAKSNFHTVFKTPSVTIENRTTSQGSNPLPVESYKGNGTNFIVNKKVVIDPEKIHDFNQIQLICLKRGIKLVVAIPPNNHSLDYNFISIFKKKCLPDTFFYEYNLNYKTPKNEFFYDVSHLNKNGAKKFTEEISIFINHNLNR